ncbi:uncharacterized protein LOC141689684 [Apium graveolens]|uniref:uncharacterized protein LOC141689684 n=1 Tax=Apium graveolens TaxID=4045 RepID=UPI003D7BD375
MLCWSIWKGHNELVWNQRGLEVGEIVASARVVLSQWRQAQDISFDKFLSLMTKEDGLEHWVLPKEKMVKINCDATIFESSNCYSSPMVVCDSRGEVIEAASKCYSGSVPPENTEAMGVQVALSWTKKHRYSNVMIKTVCLVVVQALRSFGTLRSYLGRLISECKSLLVELSYRKVCVHFVKRSTNKVADFLARSTYSLTDRIWWVNDNQLEFIDVLMNDLVY